VDVYELLVWLDKVDECRCLLRQEDEDFLPGNSCAAQLPGTVLANCYTRFRKSAEPTILSFRYKTTFAQ
jgi:hypothetical protein